jgi:hypothetical protein
LRQELRERNMIPFLRSAMERGKVVWPLRK